MPNIDETFDTFAPGKRKESPTLPYAEAKNWDNVDDDLVKAVLQIDFSMGDGRRIKSDMYDLLRMRYTDDPTLLAEDMTRIPGYYDFWATLLADAQFELEQIETEGDEIYGMYYRIADDLLKGEISRKTMTGEDVKKSAAKNKINVSDIKSYIPVLFNTKKEWQIPTDTLDEHEDMQYNTVTLPSYRELKHKKAIAEHRVNLIKAQKDAMDRRINLLPSQHGLIKSLITKPEQ